MCIYIYMHIHMCLHIFIHAYSPFSKSICLGKWILQNHPAKLLREPRENTTHKALFRICVFFCGVLCCFKHLVRVLSHVQQRPVRRDIFWYLSVCGVGISIGVTTGTCFWWFQTICPSIWPNKNWHQAPLTGWCRWVIIVIFVTRRLFFEPMIVRSKMNLVSKKIVVEQF